jgi:hypothetical protein
MSSPATSRVGVTDRDTHGAAAPRHTSRRLSTETKAAFKTTEFFAFVAVLAGILIAGAIVDSSDAGGYGRPPGLALRHDLDRRLHDLPRPREVRQPRPLRRRRQRPVIHAWPSSREAASRTLPAGSPSSDADPAVSLTSLLLSIRWALANVLNRLNAQR